MKKYIQSIGRALIRKQMVGILDIVAKYQKESYVYGKAYEDTLDAKLLNTSLSLHRVIYQVIRVLFCLNT